MPSEANRWNGGDPGEATEPAGHDSGFGDRSNASRLGEGEGQNKASDQDKGSNEGKGSGQDRASGQDRGDAIAEIERLRQLVAAQDLQLRVLHEVTAHIDRSLTYSQLFRVLLGTLHREVGSCFEAGLLFGDDHAELFRFGARERLADAALDHMLQATRRMVGRTLNRSRIHYHRLDDAGGTEDASSGCELPETDGYGSFVQVPIHAGLEPIGFLFIGSPPEQRFREDEVQLFYTLARQASRVVERLQDALTVEKRRLEAALAYLPTGVVMLGEDGRVETANPRGRAFLDALTDAAGVGDVLTRVDRLSLGELIEESPITVTLPGSNRRGDDKAKPVDRTISVMLVELAAEIAVRWLLVFNDVTESREDVRRRDRLLAMLAHELRNPLTAVRSAGDVLRDGLASTDDWPPECRDAITVVRNQSAHMQRLVSDLLDMARSTHHQIAIEPVAIDLAEVLRESVRMIEPAIEQRRQRLIVRIGDDPIPTLGDATRLTQVFSNLLHNASKFTPEGGRIDLHAQLVATDGSNPVADEEIVVTLSDTGIGLSDEELADVFEPFVKGEPSDDDQPGRAGDAGLGLGLALSRLLVERHDGTIDGRSAGRHQGATFEVRLPRYLPSEDVPTVREATRKTHRILLVEDNPDLRNMLRILLASKGHRVIEAASADEAFAALDKATPEVALLDIGLPGMDGYELGRRIRQRDPAIRLVALSGFGSPEARAESMAAGFDHHLLKPPRFEALMACLRPTRD